MRLQDDIDFTTLSWVKREIDETLNQARQALQAFAEDPSDTSQMRFCATYLHQVKGTLKMVELHGAAMVVDEMEKVATGLLANKIDDPEDAYDALIRGMVQLPDYLERLQTGHKDIPVVLLPLLNELRVIRGEQELSEMVLFSPKLDVELPPSGAGPERPIPDVKLRTATVKLRKAFEAALLMWLKADGDDEKIIGRLAAICDKLASATSVTAARRLWWISGGLLHGVRRGAVESSRPLKLLFGKVDQAMKRQALKGEKSLDGEMPDELSRQLLFHVAHGSDEAPRIVELKETFGLLAMLPEADELEHARGSLTGHNRALLDTVSDAIKEDLMSVKDGLDLKVRQSDTSREGYESLVETLDRVADTLGMLGLDVPRASVLEERDRLNAFASGEQQVAEAALMDVASSMLYVEASLDDYIDKLGAMARATPEGEAPIGGDLPSSEVRRILDALMKESSDNLQEIKRSFVEFIEAPWDHERMRETPRLLDEIVGALRMLELHEAGDLLEAVIRFIDSELLKKRAVPTAEQLDTIADAIASIEYYLEAVREHRPGRDKILDVARASLQSLGYLGDEGVERAQKAAEEYEAEEGVEPAAEERAAGDLEVVEAADEIAAAPPTEPKAKPPVQAEDHADISDDIDEEIRDVFIEEVEEEVVNLNELYPRWRADLEDQESLATIRRTFHTLKGSGRLVGAYTIGEFAWQIENLLNRILDGSREVTPPVIGLLDEAVKALPELLANVKGERRPEADIEGIKQVAEELAHGKEAYLAGAPAVPEIETPEAVQEPPELEDVSEAEEAPEPEEELSAFEEEHPEEEVAEREAEEISDAEEAETAVEAGEEAPSDVGEALERLHAEFEADEESPVEEPDVGLEDVSEEEAVESWIAASGETADEEETEPAEGEEGFDLSGLIDLPEDEQEEREAAAEENLEEGYELTLDQLEAEEPEAEAPEEIEAEELAEPEGDEITEAAEQAEAPEAVEDQPSEGLDEAAELEESLEPEPEEEAFEETAAEAPVAAEGTVEMAYGGIDPVLLDILRSEVDGHLVVIREYIDEARESTTVPPASEPLLRAVHTLNGAVSMVDVGPLSDVTGPLERYIKRLRLLERAPSEVGLVAIEESVRVVGRVVDELESSQPDFPETAELAAQLRDLSDELPEAKDLSSLFPVDEEDHEAEEAARLAGEMAGESQEAAEEASEAEPAEAAGEEAVGEVTEPEDTVEEEADWTAADGGEAELSFDLDASEEELEAEAEEPEAAAEETEEPEAPEAEAGEEIAETAEQEPVEIEATEVADTDEQAPAPEAELEEPVGEEADEEPETAELEERAALEQPEAPSEALEEETEALEPEAEVEEPSISLLPSGEPELVELEALGDIDEDLLDIFLEEGTEILDEADHKMVEWRDEPDEMGTVTELQRALHTLKGGARMAGISPVGDLSHAMESVFEAMVEGKLAGSTPIVELMEHAFDRLHQMLDRVAKRAPMPSGDRLVETMDDVLAGRALEEAAEEAPGEAEFAVEEAESVRPATAQRRTALDEETGGVAARPQQELIRVRANLLDNLVNYAGEVSIYRARLEQQVGTFRFNLVEFEQTVARLRDQLRKLEIETEAQILSRYQREAEEYDEDFDPLELDRFSQLQQYSRALAESVADLVSIQSMLDDLTRESETLLLQQSRVNSDLQEGLMRTRMVPFDSLVPRLRRILRQTTKELGKKAQLRVEGAQGEMDRTVLERITAPLEHMLRNAVAHGLESPDERRERGKSEEGAIRIRVSREATEVVIKVSDDGGGIDHERVREKALERGMLKADADLSERDLYGFILESGFSTAEDVSKIAGRGVGMDVVNSEIKQLGGSLDISSTRGEGTTFTIRLPFTLAVTHAIMVRIGDVTFAVPLSSIEGVVRMNREEFDRRVEEGDTAYEYTGEIYHLQELNTLLGIEKAEHIEGDMLPVLMSRVGDQRAAIRIDAVMSSREIVVKSVGPQISSIPGIFGATILGDGSVIMILDLGPLIRRGAALRLSEMEEEEVVEEVADVGEEAAAPEERLPVIMVVDDSITMRKVTSRVLQRHEMEVITAKDGVDALEQLQERIPDLMLLDIEMPRMDGYELATHMRNDDRLNKVPIIMITSRTGEKHRQRALELGVNRYMGKPYQEADLLDNVKELLDETVGAD